MRVSFRRVARVVRRMSRVSFAQEVHDVLGHLACTRRNRVCEHNGDAGNETTHVPNLASLHGSRQAPPSFWLLNSICDERTYRDSRRIPCKFALISMTLDL